MFRRATRLLAVLVVGLAAVLASCGEADPIAREAAGSTLDGAPRPGMLCGVADRGQTRGSAACRRERDSDGEWRWRWVAVTTTTTTDDPADEVSAFGASHGFEWESGLSVAVTSARVAARSPYAAGGRATWPVVVVRVRLTNGSGERFDADLVSVSLRYGSDGETAESVYQEGVEELSGSVAPGRTATGSYAFSVPRGEAGAITVEVAPDWDSEPGIFEGSARSR